MYIRRYASPWFHHVAARYKPSGLINIMIDTPAVSHLAVLS